jgi:hypothetical protein
MMEKNSEDAEYHYSGDMQDLTSETVTGIHRGLRGFVPKAEN